MPPPTPPDIETEPDRIARLSDALDDARRRNAALARALDESRERLRLVVTGAPVVLFSYDRDGVFTLSEGMGLADLALDPGQVVGRSVFDVYQDAPNVTAQARRALAGETVFGTAEAGGLCWETRLAPQFGPGGDVAGVIGVSTNVTERLRAERDRRDAHADLEERVQQRIADLARALDALGQENAERRRAEESLLRLLAQTEQILAAIPSLLIGLDESGRVTTWNATSERAFGVLKSETLDRTLAECGLDWDRARVEAALVECRRTGGTVRVDDLRYVNGRGADGFLGVSVSAIASYGGDPLGALLIAADVTERRTREAQQAQRQKMESIGQLAAGVAHEINTPIQYVGDNTRFLQQCFDDLAPVWDCFERLTDAAARGAVPPELAAEARDVAQQADLDFLRQETPLAIAQSLEGIGRVAQIVQAMKEFSHPGGEDKTLVDLNRALESTLTVARNEWKYVAELQTDLAPDLPPVPCLPGDLNQVFLNMIVNAAHAIVDVVGPDGARGKGVIRVGTRAVGDSVEVRIGDSGAGIPPDLRARIFDPFFTTKEVGRGTGQGLAISHVVVVDKHGGSISVESELGRGTTFTIRLPLA